MVNTITLNPAMDKILNVEKFIPGETSRVTSMVDSIGGKGTHVSINMAIMGLKNNAWGIAHGQTGKRVVQMLDEYENIKTKFNVFDYKETRTNYLINEREGFSSLVAEQGVMLTQQEISEFVQRLSDEVTEGDYLVFSGDASNCEDSELYAKMISEVKKKDVKILLDTSGKTLKTCIGCGLYLVKPNVEELKLLCDREIKNETDDVVKGIHELEKYDLANIAVSMAEAGSVVKWGNNIYRATPPKVNVVNTVGCGDCFTAGLIFASINGYSAVDMLKYATGVSAACAEHSMSVGFDMQRAIELMDKVIVEKIV